MHLLPMQLLMHLLQMLQRMLLLLLLLPMQLLMHLLPNRLVCPNHPKVVVALENEKHGSDPVHDVKMLSNPKVEWYGKYLR
jgi:hypothetical protein